MWRLMGEATMWLYLGLVLSLSHIQGKLEWQSEWKSGCIGEQGQTRTLRVDENP